MIIYKTANFDYKLFYASGGVIDIQNYSLLLAQVEEELSKREEYINADAVVSIFNNRKKVTFDYPVQLCFWNVVSKQVVCGSMIALEPAIKPTLNIAGAKQACMRLYFSEFHKPHFSELLEAFTLEEAIIL